MLRIVSSCRSVDVRATPIVLLRRICNSPCTCISIPVRAQGKVNAPRWKQKCKHFGRRAHSFIPVIIKLSFDCLVQITGIKPFFGIFHPVHDKRINFHSCLSVRYPGFTDIIAIHTESICIRSKCIIPLCLQFFRSSFQRIPVFYFFTYSCRIIGSEYILCNISTVYKYSRAALPCRPPLYTVPVRSCCLCKIILICKICFRINTQIRERHRHTGFCICIFIDIVCLR